MFRKILIFLFFLVLVTAKRLGIHVINDIQYGRWRWERRNNKTMLPSGGINIEGPYGNYRRPRMLIFNANDYDDDVDNMKNNPIQQQQQPKIIIMEKNPLMKMIQRPKFDDFWSTDDESDFNDNLMEKRSMDQTSSITNRSNSNSTSSYSTSSYSTTSYSTRSYEYDDGYWQNRTNIEDISARNGSMNDLYGENRDSSSPSSFGKNFSNQNESFSMPNLTTNA
ncbi:uncharacterized protein LOC124492049 [Dermatophagoides farinae]|uniref:uncharacterized protein LOC124492049 n=1 Tax=Dermatophagoides farinae TaxID=6954 RepID=UPI003F642C78